MLGLVMLVVALFLPAVDPSGRQPPNPLSGALALLNGALWYPSNLALIVAPLVCVGPHVWLKVVWTLILAGTFLANVTTLANPTVRLHVGLEQVFVGFWVWSASFLMSALGVSVAALAQFRGSTSGRRAFQ
jgi:hypothetical protein